MRNTFLRLAFLTLPLTFAAPAAAEFGDWAIGDNVRVRVVGTASEGGYAAAIEIELAPGWKTYWRTPGEAGIAPAFDFSGSENLAGAVVGYPPPHLFDDGFSVSNVYDGEVVLPLTVAPADPSRPLTLAVAADLGVCQDICLPVHVEAAVTIPPAVTDRRAARMIAAAEAALPLPAGAETAGVIAVARTGGNHKHPEFLLTLRLPYAGEAKVFIEAPKGWYPTHPVEESRADGAASYRFTIDRLAVQDEPIAGADLTITIVTAAGAVEDRVTLD